MKKCELLAPSGDLASAYSALNSGADAIYLGGKLFNARAFAHNFELKEIKEIVDYAHSLRKRVFVTLNIIIKDDELEELKNYIKELYLLNVDGLIVQDFGVINFIKDNYPDFFLSISTQASVDDLEGVKFFENLNAKRVVLARELPLNKIKHIKENSNIEIEVFGHGALCVCYSGQCLLSEEIGGRSGNRGKCAQPCRKNYRLVDLDANKYLTTSLNLLSLKDLKTLDDLDKLLDIKIDSLKIEGRMKNPSYVSNVTKAYKEAMNNYYNHSNNHNYSLEKTFNREFTKGHVFTDAQNLRVTSLDNNAGYLIGKVTNPNYFGYVEISLNEPLSQNDIIRIDGDSKVSSKLTKLYDKKLKLVNKLETKAYIKIKEKVKNNSLVYKTYDYNYEKKLLEEAKSLSELLPLDVTIIAKINKPLKISLKNKDISVSYESEELVSEALNYPLSENDLAKQIKLNDTQFYLNNLKIIKDDNIYLNNKVINATRRNALMLLNEKLILNKRVEVKIKKENSLTNLKSIKKEIVYVVRNQKQKEILNSLGIENVLFHELSKINNDYKTSENTLIISNYGALTRFNKNDHFLVSNYSLNTFNSLSVYNLLKYVDVVTPSLELKDDELITLASSFYDNYGFYAPLECVIYYQKEVMVSAYCPLREAKLCGKCKNRHFALEDDYTSFPLVNDSKCQMHLLASKPTNNISKIEKLKKYYSRFRVELNFEGEEEIKALLDSLKNINLD